MTRRDSEFEGGLPWLATKDRWRETLTALAAALAASYPGLPESCTDAESRSLRAAFASPTGARYALMCRSEMRDAWRSSTAGKSPAESVVFALEFGDLALNGPIEFGEIRFFGCGPFADCGTIRREVSR